MLAAQPLAVEQVRAGQRLGSSGVHAGESFDRFSVKALSRGSLGKHRRPARVGRKRPVRAGGVRKLSEPGERTHRALHLTAAHGSLDDLRQHPDRRPQPALVFGGPLGRGQGVVVATQRVVALRVAQRARSALQTDRPDRRPAA